jgi:hypothetical protein
VAKPKKTLFDAFYGDKDYGDQETPKAQARPAQTPPSTADTVPGPRGERLDADKPVNMTFTVTARERYLWSVALKKHGLTGVSVLREAMNLLVEHDPPASSQSD